MLIPIEMMETVREDRSGQEENSVSFADIPSHHWRCRGQYIDTDIGRIRTVIALVSRKKAAGIPANYYRYIIIILRFQTMKLIVTKD